MKLKSISWLPAVIIMVIIFYFSAKPAITSAESSLRISQTLINAYESFTDVSFEELVRSQVLSELDHAVRKTAHFIEYALLAAAFVLHFTIRKVGSRGKLGFSVLITAVYAMTDEFHQTFVPGRSGQVSDVLLDSCGAITGALGFLLLTAIMVRFRNKALKRAIKPQ
jgi:VanZ family protein